MSLKRLLRHQWLQRNLRSKTIVGCPGKAQKNDEIFITRNFHAVTNHSLHENAREPKYRNIVLRRDRHREAGVQAVKELEPEWKVETQGSSSQQRQQRSEKDWKKSESHQQENQRYAVKYVKWSPLPILAVLSYLQYKRLTSLSAYEHLKGWEISCYRMFPWRTFSKTWGRINRIELPLWARRPVLSWYANAFGCNIHEAEIEDLSAYRNLGEFFRRSLKPGVRAVCPKSQLISPADGTVLHWSKVHNDKVEQVKGVSYPIEAFLGPRTWNSKCDVEGDSYGNSLLQSPEHNCLYTCVIYLAPGDYHRFHSPTSWNVNFRRHFGGELLSVNPKMARWISGLFALNERAVYVGEWEYGFFSMTAVGATNVGSIRVYQDPELETNCWKIRKNKWSDKKLQFSPQKGELFGEFNLGSTIVLIFEAPKSAGSSNALEKIKVGEGILRVN